MQIMKPSTQQIPFLSIVLISLGLSASSYGQSLRNLKNRVQNTTENAANRAADRGLQKAEDKLYESSSRKGTEAAALEQQQETANAERTPGSMSSYSKYDFIPGEQIIYAEDFTGDAVGELPLNWNSNTGGVIVGIKDAESKWLQLINGTYLAGTRVATFGKDYTIEFDMVLNVTSKTGYYLPSFYLGALGSGKEDNSSNKFLSDYRIYNAFELKVEPNEVQSTKLYLRSFEQNKETFSTRVENTKLGSSLRKVIHFAIAVQGSRLRIWIDEQKAIDIPRAINTATPLNQLFFRTENSGGYTDGSFSYLLSNIKIATGKPDTRSKLLTEGKFVTTGILFDSNSDRIKPISAGVLRELAAVLAGNPELRIKITGHTDADGSAAANSTLSRKRAEAVKNTLSRDYGIDAERMETDGKGATIPVADNKTSEGKAANRRVEFTKL
jgi:OOP family OmpA-OmpF porin